jgi:tetratricopeptide (TPR) repeat protein
VFFCAILISLVVTVGASAQVTLNGNVQEDADKVVPVPNTRVVVNGSYSDTTDSIGQFSIKLSRDLIQGERVIIMVDRRGWVVNSPVDGDWNLPNFKTQNVQTTKVSIVPRGSMKLWSHERITKYVEKLSDELAKQKKEGEKPGPVDFTTYLDQYARQFGFTVQQVKEAFDEWAKKAEGSEDKRTRALAEFYRKNFLEASRLFDEAAWEKRKKREELALEEYKDWKDSGNSLVLNYNFAEALDKYREAQDLVKKERFPLEWAEIRGLTANAKSELGIRTEGKRAVDLLKEAEALYRKALEVMTREALPHYWAGTQNNLGNALQEQGLRTEGEAWQRLLAEAVAAYRRALEVLTREAQPQQWALTQNNLGMKTGK